MKELEIFKILFLVISDIQKRNQGGEWALYTQNPN